MGDTIVICEKSSQAKHIRAAIGSRFGRIFPASGHLLTLKTPDETREAWAGKWTPGLMWPGKFYEKKVVPRTANLLKEIEGAARTASRIVIATDVDREGMLIGGEIVEHLGFKGELLRATFNAEDPISLRKAFDNLRPLWDFRGLYMAGQAREQADQTVNLSLTRTVTACFAAPGSSGAIGVGRVKTAVLGIICQRELEIINFKPQDMFEVDAQTAVKAGKMQLTCSRLPASLLKEQAAQEDDGADEAASEDEISENQEALIEQEDTKGKIMRKDIADGLRGAAEGYRGAISSTSKKGKQGPPKFFDLTSLGTAAFSRFGWTAAHTLEISQKLYSERQIVTYPRGESRYLPEVMAADIPKLAPALLALSAFSEHRDLIAKPTVRKTHYSDKGYGGAAHHAIIPNVNMASNFASVVPSLGADERKLWELIVNQYLAGLAPDFEYRQTNIELLVPWKGHDWSFRTSGRIPLVPGWKAILGGTGSNAKGDEKDLPAIEKGEQGHIEAASLRTVTTKPPARYNDGSIMRLMQEAWRLVPPGPKRDRLKEATGIGTPATRKDVAPGLIEQRQIEVFKKALKPTAGGLELYKTLLKVAPNVVDPIRTAEWEMIFDKVETNEITAEKALAGILRDAQGEIERIQAASEGVELAIGSTRKPTAKMAAAAKRIAERKGIKLPPKCLSDSQVCAKFLNEHLPKRDPNAPAGAGGVFPPSEKQLAFAKKMAAETGTDLPEEALKNSKALSTWLDGVVKKAGPRPPSEKQLAFARKLAEENDIDLPADVKSDMKKCSAFIDSYMGKGKAKGKSKARA